MSAHVLFPLRLDARGRTTEGDAEEYLRGLVEQVLFTRPGERAGRPRFGSGLAGLLFEPLDADLAGTVETLVRTALQEAMGDLIRIDDVAVTVEDSAVAVTISFAPLQRPGAQVSAVFRPAGGTP